MKNNRSLRFFCTLIVAAFLVAQTGCEPGDNSSGESTNEDQKVRVAINLPLTGPIAALSGQYPNGFSMGVADASQRLDVAGDRFTINAKDNAGKPSQAVSVMQQQRLNNPDAYISGTSEMSKAVAPQVKEMGIPHFPIAFDAYLANKSENRLRIFPHYKAEGPLYVKYAKMRDAEKVYIINLNIASINEEFSTIVEPGLTEAGIEHKRITFGSDTRRFRSLALKAAQYQPDLILISGFSFQLYPLLDALRTQGLVEDGSVLATMDFVVLLNNDTSRSELTGVAFITPRIVIPGVVEEIEEWRRRYKNQFGKEPSYVEAYAYDTGRVLVATYAKFGKVTVENIRKTLPFDGLVGTIRLDQAGDLISTLAIAKVQQDGSIAPVAQTFTRKQHGEVGLESK